jgi:hypothetical protein
LVDIFRLEIQAKVRQLGRRPSGSDRQKVESAREQLTVLLHEMKNAMEVAGLVERNTINSSAPEPLTIWDDIINEPIPTGPYNSVPDMPDISDEPAPSSNHQSSKSNEQIEDRLIPLPSNDNIQQDYAQLELTHRISHADHHLSRIRDLIAEKSFQYSHVIRSSPRKSVNTHSRGAVKRINFDISVHCRLYSQCWSRIQKLGGDQATLQRLQKLTVDDIKASTAIINPNVPGSTQLKLSWIWQTAGGHRWGFTSGTNSEHQYNDQNLIECKFYLLLLSFFETYLFTVRRVHWLRARAQLMRWQEQVKLVSYEMQWTVRYFFYKSQFWLISPGIADVSSSSTTGIVTGSSTVIHTGTGTSPLTPGAIAYRSRQQALWLDLAMKTNQLFSRVNKAYQSPL